MRTQTKLISILYVIALMLQLSSAQAQLQLTPEQQAEAEQMRQRRNTLIGQTSDLEQELVNYWATMQAYADMGDAMTNVPNLLPPDYGFFTGAEIAAMYEAGYQQFLTTINNQYSAIASEISEITDDLVEMGAELIFTPADPPADPPPSDPDPNEPPPSDPDPNDPPPPEWV